MPLRVMRVGAAVLLGASGALMYAASWQRWGGVCSWGKGESGACSYRQDHRYDFVAPSPPWEPVGHAAELAGWSLIVLALAFVALPWASTGRRPGALTAVALLGAVVGLAVVGLATLQSGLAGHVVHPPFYDLAGYLWVLLPPALLIRFGIAARGWGRAAAVLLFLSTPLVASFTYAIGPYDAQPWWEAVSAVFIASSAACLLVSTVFAGVLGRWASAVTAGVSRAATPR
jgi:hypothetical protein